MVSEPFAFDLAVKPLAEAKSSPARIPFVPKRIVAKKSEPKKIWRGGEDGKEQT